MMPISDRPKPLRAAAIAALLLLASVAACFPIAVTRGMSLSLGDSAGVVVLLELMILLFMAVVPAAWRLSTVGWRAIGEPVCLMGVCFLLYYVFRGFLLLFRDPTNHDGMVFRHNPSHVDLALTLAYVIAGFAAYYAGYRFWNPGPATTAARHLWPLERMKGVLVVTGVAAVFSAAVAFRICGGLRGLTAYFGCLRLVTVGYGYPLLGLTNLGVVSAFLLYDRLRRQRNFALPLAMLAGASLWAAAVGDRAGVLTAWTSCFLIYFYGSPSHRPMRTAALLCGVLASGIAFSLPMARAREACSVAFLMDKASSSLTQTAPPPETQATPAPSATTSARAPGASAKPSIVKPPVPAAPIVTYAPHWEIASEMPKHPPQVSQSQAGALSAQRTQILRANAVAPDRKLAVKILDEFLALDAFAAVISAGPQKFPFRHGKTFLDGVIFIVPRRIWPGKPVSYSSAVGQYLQNAPNDIPPGYIGELYINFHIAGILGGMYLLGLLFRYVQKLIYQNDPIAITAYALLAPFLVTFLGRSFIGGGTMVLIDAGLMLPTIYYLRRPAREAQIAHASGSGSPEGLPCRK